MRISDWSSDVCSSDLIGGVLGREVGECPFAEQCFIFAGGRRGRCGRNGGGGTLRDLLGLAVALDVLLVAERSRRGCPGCFRWRTRLEPIVPVMQSGRASCRERVCQYVKISVGAVS